MPVSMLTLEKEILGAFRSDWLPELNEHLIRHFIVFLKYIYFVCLEVVCVSRHRCVG